MASQQVSNLRVAQDLIQPIAAKQQAFANLHFMIDDVYLEPIKFGISDEMRREAAHETGSCFRLHLCDFSVVNQLIEETVITAKQVSMRLAATTSQQVRT